MVLNDKMSIFDSINSQKENAHKRCRINVCRHFSQTGDERIELPPKVLETPIIPFDQSPKS